MKHATLPPAGDLRLVVARFADGRLIAVTAPLDAAEATKRAGEYGRNQRHNAQARRQARFHKTEIVGYGVLGFAGAEHLVEGPFFDDRPRRQPSQAGFDAAESRCAQAWGEARGYRQQPGHGGWILSAFGPVVNGWFAFARQLRQDGRIAAGPNRSWWILNTVEVVEDEPVG